jgi:hypothetical protein
MSNTPNDWNKRIVGLSVAMLTVWLTWVSASVVQLVAADARDTVSLQQVTVDRETLASLVTQVAVMDIKMNLLLLSNGIQIPQEQPVTKKQ